MLQKVKGIDLGFFINHFPKIHSYFLIIMLKNSYKTKDNMIITSKCIKNIGSTHKVINIKTSYATSKIKQRSKFNL